MFRVLTKAWMPLLLVVVVALGAYAVLRIRGDIGGHELTAGAASGGGFTDPFNPKNITYEISSSSSGGPVSVDYLDENGQPHHVDAHAALVVHDRHHAAVDVGQHRRPGRYRRLRSALSRRRRRSGAR